MPLVSCPNCGDPVEADEDHLNDGFGLAIEAPYCRPCVLELYGPEEADEGEIDEDDDEVEEY